MNRLYLILCLTVLLGCSSEDYNSTKSQATTEEEKSKYLRWVGDSKFNNKLDDEDFKLCYSEKNVQQYFHVTEDLFAYQGEKKALVAEVLNLYKPIETQQSGWIRVRFIVNCKGETGRFRVISSDENYKERDFDERITNQIVSITESLKGWEIRPNEAEARDYYQYLVFKINNGKIAEILP